MLTASCQLMCIESFKSNRHFSGKKTYSVYDLYGAVNRICPGVNGICSRYVIVPYNNGTTITV